MTHEQALFISISEGDETAFSTCYSEYGRVLMPFLVRLVGSRDSAEEIIQEVFLKVWLYRDRLAEVDNPRSWLFRVAANTGRNWLKKKMLIEQKMQEHQRQWDIPDSAIPEQVDLKSIAGVIQRTILSFPPQRRRIYQMSREEGLKPAEIAARLELSVSTVKNTLLSALKTIRENIEEAGFWVTFFLVFLKK
ncbi:MAG TPA: RNA polymerase sigma-70 factor [Puia sp.]|nr:RNA polymerase sigma-70 factor [Puia sp.]